MAERRMFAKTIIDSDAFLDMPQSTQLLYFHLSMRGDDEGFINNPKSIMRNVKCNEDDFKLLIAKKFIIPFESGIVVIKHWKIHNYIAKDRFKETKYKLEKSMLVLDENNSYKLNEEGSYTECIQGVHKVDTQVRIGKDRLGKDRLDKDNNKSLLSLYEELGFGTINTVVYEDLNILEKEYTETWVTEALKEANNQGKRNLKYVVGILKNWKANGYKAERPKQVKPGKESKFNNFTPREYDYADLERRLLGHE